MIKGEGALYARGMKKPNKKRDFSPFLLDLCGVYGIFLDFMELGGALRSVAYSLFAREGPARGGLLLFARGDLRGGFGSARKDGGGGAAGVGKELSGEILLGLFGGFEGRIGAGRGLDGETKVVIFLDDEFGLIDLENGLVRGAEGIGGGAMDFLVDDTGATRRPRDVSVSNTEIALCGGIDGFNGLFIGFAEGGVVERFLTRE